MDTRKLPNRPTSNTIVIKRRPNLNSITHNKFCQSTDSILNNNLNSNLTGKLQAINLQERQNKNLKRCTRTNQDCNNSKRPQGTLLSKLGIWGQALASRLCKETLRSPTGWSTRTRAEKRKSRSQTIIWRSMRERKLKNSMKFGS